MSPVDGTLKQKGAYEFDFDGNTYNREPHLKLDDSTWPSQVGRVYFAGDFDNRRFNPPRHDGAAADESA